MKLTLEQIQDEIESPLLIRPRVKTRLRIFLARFYEHLSTYTCKEDDNDYIKQKYGDSGHA